MSVGMAVRGKGAAAAGGYFGESSAFQDLLPVRKQVPGLEARMIGNGRKGVHSFICVPGRIRLCGL